MPAITSESMSCLALPCPALPYPAMPASHGITLPPWATAPHLYNREGSATLDADFVFCLHRLPQLEVRMLTYMVRHQMFTPASGRKVYGFGRASAEGAQPQQRHGTAGADRLSCHKIPYWTSDSVLIITHGWVFLGVRLGK